MDTNDLKQEEEIVEATTDTQSEDGDVSLDDMMAASVPVTDGKTPETSEEESEEKEEASEESTETETETETAEETPTEETSGDMVDEVNEEVKEETEAIEEATGTTQPLPPRKEYRGKWYIVHTYSGHENKVAKTLMQRVQAMGFEERIFDALVPTRDTIRVRGGKKETIKEKIFPGYILVNMDLSDEAWVLVRTTPGVTSFVGAQNKPTPIRDDEVQAIVAFVGQKDPVYKAQFSVGEAVKITDGPFSDFLGTVESIDEAKGKIKVLVSIFGRETPVELDFLQVAKI